MKNIAVSFDMWCTIINPNTNFADARRQSIADFLSADVDDVAEAYSVVHRIADEIQETLGICLRVSDLWVSFLHKFCEITNRDISKLINMHAEDYNKFKIVRDLIAINHHAFLKHPPKVADGIGEMFEKLLERKAKIGIISNTSFIPGHWLYESLTEQLSLSLMKRLSFVIFSDNYGMSKPNGCLFHLAADICSDRIMMHVGDSIKTDQAALSHGFEKFILVPYANKTADIVSAEFNL